MKSNSTINVLLVGAEDEENLALRYLASVLIKKGHHVLIAPCSRAEQIKSVLRQAKRFRPQLIGVSLAFQSLANLYFQIISNLKTAIPTCHITVGGHFPTFEYKKILETQKDIDSIIRFEGETPILQLSEAIIGNRKYSSVNNLVYRDGGKLNENTCITKFQNLDELPYPIRSKKPLERIGEKFATLVFSRGCFHSSCLYCCIGAFHSGKKGQKYALRSPQNIAKEISELYHLSNVRLFQFHDDNFMLPSKDDTLKRFTELRQALIKEGINLKKIAFLIKARPDSIDDRIAKALYDLGVVGVFLGVENACDSGLKSLIRGSAVADITTAMDCLAKYPIAITFNLLIFHPNANLDEINENIYFIKNHLDYALDFGRAEIVAGSPLEKQVINEKLLRGNWPVWDYRLKDAAVERLFRINLLTFRRKGSHYSRLVHSLIALGYQAQLINRIYPGRISERLLNNSKSLIRKSNGIILRHILKIYKLSAQEAIRPETIDDEFSQLDNDTRILITEIEQLSSRMTKLQILEKKFEEFGITNSVQEHPIICRLFGFG